MTKIEVIAPFAEIQDLEFLITKSLNKSSPLRRLHRIRKPDLEILECFTQQTGSEIERIVEYLSLILDQGIVRVKPE